MPRLKRPSSLYYQCLHSIVLRVIDKCRRKPGECKTSLSELRRHRLAEYIESIPNYAANEYTAEVLRQLADIDPSEVWVHWLLHPGTTQLQATQSWKILDALQKHWVAIVTHLPAMTRLQQLNLDFCGAGVASKDDAGAFRKFHESLGRLHWLTSVELSHVCTSEILHTIANGCPLLKKVVAEDCALKSQDIRVLLQCRHLLRVQIESYDDPVTPEDIAYLVKGLPKLQFILIDGVNALIDILASDTPDGTTYPIRTLGVINETLDSDHLDQMCRIFPHLDRLQYLSPTLDVLCTLRRFPKLKELNMKITARSHLQDLVASATLQPLEILGLFFPEGNSPSMSTLGYLPNLTYLDLFAARDIDIASVANSCPSLKDLVLRDCSYIPVRSTGSLPKLNQLMITGGYNREVLYYLLSRCPEVETLILGESDLAQETFPISDRLWRKAVRHNPMNSLKILQVCSSRLTRDFISMVLRSHPCLTRLILVGDQWNSQLPESAFPQLNESLRKFDMTVTVTGAGTHFYCYSDTSVEANSDWEALEVVGSIS